MTNHINSIFRIHRLLTNIPPSAQNTQVLEVWAKVFEVNESETNKKASAVSERLGWVLREIESAKMELQNTGHPIKLYEDVLNDLELAFSPMQLPSTWNYVQQYIGEKNMHTLAIYSQVIPDEETLINTEELNELYARISELESFLVNSELPNRLLGLIQRHINLIKQALAEYPIAGAKALVEARRAAYGELFEYPEVLYDTSSETIKLTEIWSDLNKIADGAIKAEGIYQLAKNAWPLLENFMK